MTDKNQSPQEMFETVKNQYDDAHDRFSEFRDSPFGKKHRKTIDSFVHESNRQASKLGYSLLTGNLPKRGKISVLWGLYNEVLTSIGLMNLILELWGNMADNGTAPIPYKMRRK